MTLDLSIRCRGKLRTNLLICTFVVPVETFPALERSVALIELSSVHHLSSAAGKRVVNVEK